jgi:hypothetical protein
LHWGFVDLFQLRLNQLMIRNILKQKEFLTGDIPFNDKPSYKYFKAEPNQF